MAPSPAEWKQRAEERAAELLALYKHRRAHERDRQLRSEREEMDSAQASEMGEVLRKSLGIPRTGTQGLDWPVDVDGFIIQRVEDRLEHSREVFRKRSESTTARPSPDTQRGAMLAALMDASVTFSEEERTILEAPFKMEELEAAFKQAGKGTAPGVSGITYRQWEEGPPRAKRLTLVLFNKMLETATVPRIFRLGRICPIPKDVSKPVTESNARPLTMLECGLKLMTTCLNNRFHDSLKRSPVFTPVQAAFLPDTDMSDLIGIVAAAQKDARERKKDLHCAFLDLAKAFEKVENWASAVALERLGGSEEHP